MNHMPVLQHRDVIVLSTFLIPARPCTVTTYRGRQLRPWPCIWQPQSLLPVLKTLGVSRPGQRRQEFWMCCEKERKQSRMQRAQRTGWLTEQRQPSRLHVLHSMLYILLLHREVKASDRCHSMYN